MSDGIDNVAASQASGNLPTINLLTGQAGSGDEGTAMLEIVYDIAPGAQLYFATGFSGIANFAQNIRNLRALGCTIIIDDVSYSNETAFQNGQAANVTSQMNSGVVVQAVNDVTVGSQAGALYFSSAGNSGNRNDGTSGAWEGDFVDGGVAGGVLTGAGNLHNFGGTVVNTINSSGGSLVLQWSDPLGGSANDYDLYVLNSAGNQVVAMSNGDQSGTQDPIESLPPAANVAGNLVVVAKYSGANRFLHLNTNRGRLNISTSGVVFGHNAGLNTISVAATPAANFQPSPNPVGPFPNIFNSGNKVELFSSDGPRRIFYNADSSPITPGNVSSTGGIALQKPDITAADGVSVTGAGGFTTPFFGTSAAAPHAGALAALVKSACSSSTNSQFINAMKATAIDIEAAGTDRDSGAGIFMPIPTRAALCGSTCPTTSISAGQTLSGSLTTSDCVFTGTTRYVDLYVFTGTAGQRVAVSMNSSAFDTYLFLVDSNNQIIAQDDNSGGGTNSRIPANPGYFTLPAAGTYTVYATSLNAGSVGAYSVSLINEPVCNYSITPTSQSFSASGGNGSTSVNTQSGCAWTATSNAQWITTSSSGSGSNTAGFTVAANSNAARTGTVTIAGQTLTISQAGAAAPSARKSFDFDGDGKADIAVFRPDNGVWYLQQSTNGFTGLQFGAVTDKIASADYDGDGKADLAVYRSGTWYLNRTQAGFTGVAFGESNDIPVPADYDGDGKADIAVFRPSNGTWYLQRSSLGFTAVQFGQMGDKPVAADYDGDGKADIAVNRNGTWYLNRSQLGFTGIEFGDSNDKLVPADYDGDGKADVAVFRPSNGVWYLLQSTAGFVGIQFGANGDAPTPADYDGDGKADQAVYRAGIWYLNRSAQGFTGVQFGVSTDLPVSNAYVR